MFEVLKTSEVVKYKNGDDLTVGRFMFAVTRFLAVKSGNFLWESISAEYSLQKSSAKQKISVILSLLSKLIIIDILLYFRYKCMNNLLV